MNGQRSGSGFREPSIWLCLLLSLFAHAALAWWALPFDFQRKTPEARRGGERRILLVQRKPKPHTTGVDKDEPKKEPRWVKTSSEQKQQRPQEPDFIGRRSTTASGGRKQPDNREGELLPDQDGRERRGEIVLFDQERQEGDLAHDGKKRATPAPPSTPLPPSPPTRPAPSTALEQPTPSAAPTPPAQAAPHSATAQKSPAPSGETAAPGLPEGKEGHKEAKTGRDQDPTPRTPVASVRERKPDPRRKDLLTTPVAFNTQPAIPIPSFGSPQGRSGTIAVLPAGVAPSASPSRRYDPSFTEESQPGFRTQERRTRTTGRFVFGSNPSMNVASTPRGRYEELIYRRVAYFWYLECDANREMIVPGSIQIRILVNTQGQITSMDLLRRTGASVSQQGFTFRAIRSADLPPMPQVVRDDVVGNKMELVFTFNFD